MVIMVCDWPEYRTISISRETLRIDPMRVVGDVKYMAAERNVK
jgi:hypothetical protein